MAVIEQKNKHRQKLRHRIIWGAFVIGVIGVGFVLVTAIKNTKTQVDKIKKNRPAVYNSVEVSLR